MKLSSYLLKRKVRSLAEKAPGRKHSFRNLTDARDILLVYSLEDQEEVDTCKKRLKSLNKKVHSCIYVPYGASTPEETDKKELLVRNEKDTDLWYLPNDDVLDSFNNIPADILIDLTRPSDHVMHYLVLSHPSELKVGRKNDVLPMHDLAIQTPDSNDICYLFDNIIFYLQSIRSK